MKTEITKNILLLQCCTLLLVLTLLPEFDLISMFTGIDLDIPVIICKLIGVVGIGITLLKVNKQKQEINEAIPIPLFVLSGGGALLTFFSLIPSFPAWMSYIGLLLLFISLFICKNMLHIEWSKVSANGAYLILLAVILHTFSFINNTTATITAALIGLILYIIGLSKLNDNMDINGQNAVSKLKIAVIISILAAIFDYIPLMGWVSTIFAIVAFIFEFLGYSALMTSETIGYEGKKGATLLRNSMIVLIVAAICGLLSDTLAGILAIVTLFLTFSGWTQIVFGLQIINKNQDE